MQTDILATIDMMTLGVELQAARKRSGMRQEDAAAILGVSRTTITAIENGKRRITAPELFKLARAYKCQLSDFVRERPHVHPSPEQFRGPDALSEADQQAIEPHVGTLIEYARTYVELEHILQSPLARRYPAEYSTKGPIERVAERIAIEERQRLSLGDGPIGNLRDTLEQCVGLRIFYMPLPNGFSEIYIYDDVLGGCLAVNQNHPEERRRWSLAHGYLHFLAHRTSPDVYKEENRRFSPGERLADAFARFFLMPSNSLMRSYNDIVDAGNSFSPSDLLTMAHFYGVSVEALALRLEDMDLLPTGTWQSLKKRGFPIRQFQEQLGLRIAVRDDIFPLRYQILAFTALNEGHISEGQFAHFLRRNRFEARSMLEELESQSDAPLDGDNEDTSSDALYSAELVEQCSQ